MKYMRAIWVFNISVEKKNEYVIAGMCISMFYDVTPSFI